jgi:hypothetical protein
MRMVRASILLAMHLCVGTILATTHGDQNPIDFYHSNLIDSLEANGVDSIVAIRYWTFGSGRNGYGRLVWKHNGETIGRYVESVNRDIDHRLTRTMPMSDTIIGMAKRTLLSTHTSGLEFGLDKRPESGL